MGREVGLGCLVRDVGSGGQPGFGHLVRASAQQADGRRSGRSSASRRRRSGRDVLPVRTDRGWPGVKMSALVRGGRTVEAATRAAGKCETEEPVRIAAAARRREPRGPEEDRRFDLPRESLARLDGKEAAVEFYGWFGCRAAGTGPIYGRGVMGRSVPR